MVVIECLDGVVDGRIRAGARASPGAFIGCVDLPVRIAKGNKAIDRMIGRKFCAGCRAAAPAGSAFATPPRAPRPGAARAGGSHVHHGCLYDIPDGNRFCNCVRE